MQIRSENIIKRKINCKFILISLMTIFLLFLIGCGGPNNSINTNQSSNLIGGTVDPDPNQISETGDLNLKVHFLDVGQADAILIQLPNSQTMLIDAGNNDDGTIVVAYLKQQGVQTIDYLIGTHPHEDHIGGLDNVIRNFNISQIYLPKITNTTKTYEDVLLAIKAKGLKITTAQAGKKIIDQNNLQADFVAPVGSKYESLNNWSVVTKVQYEDTTFIFAGDAEAEAEVEMLASGVSLKADVLKIGHHGSRTSSSMPFLKAVSPMYTVISVGKGNDYGHPHPETLSKLSQLGIPVYRTDLFGNLEFISDGQNIAIKTMGKQMK